MVGFGYPDAASLAVSMWLGNAWRLGCRLCLARWFRCSNFSHVRQRTYCSVAAPSFRRARQLVRAVWDQSNHRALQKIAVNWVAAIFCREVWLSSSITTMSAAAVSKPTDGANLKRTSAEVRREISARPSFTGGGSSRVDGTAGHPAHALDVLFTPG